MGRSGDQKPVRDVAVRPWGLVFAHFADRRDIFRSTARIAVNHFLRTRVFSRLELACRFHRPGPGHHQNLTGGSPG